MKCNHFQQIRRKEKEQMRKSTCSFHPGHPPNNPKKLVWVTPLSLIHI